MVTLTYLHLQDSGKGHNGTRYRHRRKFYQNIINYRNARINFILLAGLVTFFKEIFNRQYS